jgi:hypothetical protein
MARSQKQHTQPKKPDQRGGRNTSCMTAFIQRSKTGKTKRWQKRSDSSCFLGREWDWSSQGSFWHNGDTSVWRGLSCTGMCTCGESPIATLKSVHLLPVNFIIKKKTVSKYWTLVNDMHEEVSTLKGLLFIFFWQHWGLNSGPHAC